MSFCASSKPRICKTSLPLPNVSSSSLRTPIRLANREIFASTSIGIAHVDERYESGADIIRDADTAMYRAKNNGGMRFELFHETMHERALATLRAQMDLRAAIDRTEF